MNIQVATSELPVTSIRGGPRLSSVNYTQRPQTRFRGNRGTGSIRGNLLIQIYMYIFMIINLSKLTNNKIDRYLSHSYIFCCTSRDCYIKYI